jgi:O-antigen/teichoic acid export membrane protein
LNIGLTILFVIYFEWGIEGIFLAMLFSSLLNFLLCLYMMKDWLSFSNYDKNLHKKMINFGLPLVPASIAYWVSNSSASYFLNFSLNQTEVGLFQVGASLATGVLLITGAFQMAIGPFIFSQKDGPDIKLLINRVFLGYISITTIIVSVISVFAYEILVILTREAYYPSKSVVPVLAFNFFLLGLNYIGALGLNIAKDNKPYMYAVISGSVLNILLFFLLIPIFGIVGAAWSMTLSNIVVTSVIFNSSIKRYPIKFYFFRGLPVVFLGAIVSFMANPWVPEQFWIGVLWKVVLILVLILMIGLISFPKLKLNSKTVTTV